MRTPKQQSMQQSIALEKPEIDQLMLARLSELRGLVDGMIEEHVLTKGHVAAIGAHHRRLEELCALKEVKS